MTTIIKEYKTFYEWKLRMVDVNPKFIRLFSFKVIIMRFVCKFTKALNIVETLFQLENKKYLKFKYIYIYI